MDADEVCGLQPEARRQLLLVLQSDSRVRAEVIRQFHERGDDVMVETLTELEADELLRSQVIEGSKSLVTGLGPTPTRRPLHTQGSGGSA